MNENPFETPNPLNNPNPQPTPATPPMPNGAMGQNFQQPSPIGPIAPNEPMTPNEPISNNQIPNMQQANLTTEPPVKPKKTGAIIGIILAILALIGASVAIAFFLLSTNNTDAFSKAMEKIVYEGIPEYVELDGSISLTGSEENSAAAGVLMTMNSKMNSRSLVNDTKLALNMTLMDEPVSLELNELYTEDGKIYLKFNELKQALENEIISGLLESFGMNTQGIAELAEKVDGKWIKVFENAPLASNDNISRLENAIDKNELVKLYKEKPFLAASNKDVAVAKKKDPIYKVTVDKDALMLFSQNMLNKITEIMEQQGIILWDNGDAMNIINGFTELENVVASAPSEFYVEIDKNNNMTRFYLDGKLADAEMKYVIDFSINYPSSLEIKEPSEFTDFETLLGDSPELPNQEELEVEDEEVVKNEIQEEENTPEN